MAVNTYGERTSFVQPQIELEPSEKNSEGIKTVNELVEFHAKVNPTHRFCIQAQKSGPESEVSFLDVTYASLKRGILSCQIWLREKVNELQPPRVDSTGRVTKGAPIAIFMDSNTSLILYVFALMGLGVPVILFSTRLSSAAIRHLLDQTGAGAILFSPRLQNIVDEALSSGFVNQNGTNESLTNGDVANISNGGAHGLKEESNDQLKKNAVLYCPPTYEELLQEKESSGFTSKSTIRPYHYVSETDCHVLILHSSGTTGLPKPIYTSHRQQLSFALCHDFKTKSQMTSPTLSTSPLFHVSKFAAESYIYRDFG
jgi:acyl-CoA synthetase (AMP-forming)/AMP-acid ligase II